MQTNPKVLGDFNDHCLTWESKHENSELGQKFFDLVTGNNLFQILQDQLITGTSASQIDLIITDSPACILDSGVSAPIGDPYHCCIYCKFKLQHNRKEKYTRHVCMVL